MKILQSIFHGLIIALLFILTLIFSLWGILIAGGIVALLYFILSALLPTVGLAPLSFLQITGILFLILWLVASFADYFRIPIIELES